MGSVASDAPSPGRPRVRRGWLILSAAVVVLALDQVAKHWAVTRLSPEGSPGIHLVGSLWFRLAFNSGMSFSLGTGMGPVVGLIALAIIGVLFWLSRSIHSRVQLVLVGVEAVGAADDHVMPPVVGGTHDRRDERLVERVAQVAHDQAEKPGV